MLWTFSASMMVSFVCAESEALDAIFSTDDREASVAKYTIAVDEEENLDADLRLSSSIAAQVDSAFANAEPLALSNSDSEKDGFNNDFMVVRYSGPTTVGASTFVAALIAKYAS